MSAISVCRGLERDTLDEGAVVCYTASEIGPGTLVPWRDSVIQTLKDWPDDRPYLALHDLSAKGVSVVFLTLSGREILNVGITQIGQSQVEALLLKRPALKIRLALVVSAQYSGQLTLRLGMGLFKNIQPQIDT